MTGAHRGITMLAIGSRGDVQPMAALARGLQAAGHQPKFIGMDDYSDLVRGGGGDFRSLGCSMDTMEAAARGWRGRASLRSPMFQLDLLRRWLASLAQRLDEVVSEVVEDGDIVVTGLLTRDVAAALTTARDCRMVTVLHTANVPSAEPHSCMNALPRRAPASARRRRARLGWVLSSGVSLAASAPLRRRYDLPLTDRKRAADLADRWPILLAASPVVVPPAADWPSTVQQTGAIVDDDPIDGEPPTSVVDFLDAGPAPLYVGFGSAAQASRRHAERLQQVVVEAAARTGQRVITPTFDGQPAGLLGPDVLAVGSVRHAWLFPRTAGIIHHGGAGTTVAGLLSGVPSMALPFALDQPYHARRLAELGVGPPPVPIRRITPARLAVLYRDLRTGPAADRYRHQATLIAKQVAREAGVAAAVAAIGCDKPAVAATH